MLKSVLVIALLATSHLLAADFSGRWAGTLETNGNRVPIYFTLNEHGGKISGSVATGPAPLAIENGEVRYGQLSFEDASGLMHFRLKLTNGVLGGEAMAGREVSKVAVVPVDGSVAGGGSGTGSGVGCSVYRIGGGVSAPVLIQKVEPEYTEQARAAKYQGTVLLYVEIGPDGAPTNIRVQRSLGLGLDEKAIEAVKQWRFKPGEKDGNPVPVSATIEVNFRL